MAKKIIPVEDLVAAANARRSPLYVWMLENHAIFRVVVTEAIRPNWAALAQRFAAEGLNDADDKAPTAETVRQTWWRVRKTLDARQKSAARRGQAQKVAPPPPPPAVQAMGGDPESKEAPGDVTAVPRRPLILKPARALAPDENPQDDGSKLPKPFHRR